VAGDEPDPEVKAPGAEWDEEEDVEIDDEAESERGSEGCCSRWFALAMTVDDEDRG
jgi:hypothetical protein